MNPRWIGIAGPTASGKSALALTLAAALARPVELVSVDSAQVYRGMDIGTAKPGAAERARLPHHLIDLIDPAQAYSAARFVADATAAIAAIEARGALPLLVGGTMLYFKALIEGLDAIPAADPALRAAIEAEAAARGWPALHAELARVDPATALRLAPHDAQRIQRALEVWRASGRPLSAHQQRKAAAAANAAPAVALIALEPPAAAGCMRASSSALRRCSRPGWSTRCARCVHAATCTRGCRRCAASATARSGRRSTPAWTATRCTRSSWPPASPRRASSPSGN